MASELADATLLGAVAVAYAGRSLAGADLDGDGLGDLVVGTAGNAEVAAYVALAPVTGASSLEDAHTRLIGDSGAAADSNRVVSGEDINGDGVEDLLVAQAHGADRRGMVFLVTTLPAQSADLYVRSSARIEGMDGGFGESAALGGDLDGDGHGDLLLGAPEAADPAGVVTGAVYLLYGPVQGTVDPLLPEVVFVGHNADDAAGASVVGLGDVDGRGLPDFAVGAPGKDRGGSDAGLVYVGFGEDL